MQEQVPDLRRPEPFVEPPEYHTPPGKKRAPKLPALAFYPRLLQLVWHSSRLAKRGRYDRAAWCRSSHWFFRIAETCGGRFHIQGLDRLVDLDSPVVFVANHMSTLETFTLPGLLLPHTPLAFVVKESLVRMPLFGHVMKATRPVVVTRRDPRRDLRAVLTQGVEKLHAGASICLFPQTTRAPVFRPAQFNTLAVKLAARADVPLIPIALKSDFWGTGKVVRDFGPIRPELDIHLAFGPRMFPAGQPRQVHAEVIAFLTEHLRAWGVPCEQ
ncbi:MAG: 1-acyl-sn-glycerol-3-phosphate acyltransferase [Kiritimatiellaeota bacterium]|nr:1-acyl-sn-glycerol-3-phosphate acyltransferase [Kiritimatiellota bacterium]